MQETIQITTAVCIVNKRITTPVTLDIRPNKSSSNVNIVLVPSQYLLHNESDEPYTKQYYPSK